MSVTLIIHNQVEKHRKSFHFKSRSADHKEDLWSTRVRSNKAAKTQDSVQMHVKISSYRTTFAYQPLKTMLC